MLSTFNCTFPSKNLLQIFLTMYIKNVAMKNVKLRLLFVYTIPCGNTHMEIGHLSTHVPSAKFNDADGGKK
jgi:hypothetical protein